MTEMHDGPAGHSDGSGETWPHLLSAHIDPGAEDVVSIYSNAAQGVCIIAFRHTDDAKTPFFPLLFGDDGLFVNPRTSRAATSVVMFVFLGVYLLIGWTSWLDCLDGGKEASAEYDGTGNGALAGCTDQDILFSHRMDKIRWVLWRRCCFLWFRLS